MWDLKENGYRKSYGIVTAMFGLTIFGSWVFRVILANLNKQLEEREREAEALPEGTSEKDDFSGGMIRPEEALKMTKGFRYLI